MQNDTCEPLGLVVGAAPRTPTVLVVDDIPANLALMFDHLEEAGFRVVVAQDADEALKRAEFVLPDLILLDVMLPDMSGFEVCRRLKQNAMTRTVPVIFMTALGDTRDKRAGFEAGGVDYITKPFEAAEVLMRVNTHLALSAAYGKMARQNTQLQVEADFRAGQAAVLEMISMNAALDEVLAKLVKLIESQFDALLGSIALLDGEGHHVQCTVAPSLPASFSQSLAGLRPGPRAGSCGTAMFRRAPVLVSDILDDPLWGDCRAAVAPYGLRACWSTPMVAADGQVLGAFAMYCRQVRQPDSRELELIKVAAHIACIAIGRERAHASMRHMARHDALTGLPNRLLLADRLGQAIAMSHRNGDLVALLFIDLDHFKHINDSLGHHVGDRLLLATAGRLQCCLRDCDTVARLGGDEFVIILPALAESRHAAVVAEKVLGELAAPFEIDEHALHIGASIGISLFPLDGGDADTLLRTADTAMYDAKGNGRSNYKFFRAALNEAAQQRLALECQLRQALPHGEFELHYQPQVSLQSGAVVGVEALLRWRHPEHGVLAPARFMALLEESDLMVEVGRWVLRSACLQSRAWQDAGLAPIRMAVNLSVRQFQRGADLLGSVAEVLRETGLAPEWLELEITEGVILDDSADNLDTLHALKRLGVGLALDDFGTGYSSLAYLRRFPVDRIKIDRSFLRDISSCADSGTIVRSIAGLARNLGLGCVAEGVETAEQLGFLQKLHCNEMQGFFFSEPLPAPALAALLRAQRRLDAAQPAAAAGYTVLLVDDDDGVRHALTRLLLREGLRVLAAAGAVEGFSLLAQQQIGVVLCDQRMPGMGGSEFLREVRGLYPDTVRILLTGHADLPAIIDAVNQGGLFRVLTKPWQDQALLEHVREAFHWYGAWRGQAGG